MPAANVDPSSQVPPALWRMAFAAGLASYLDAATIISVSISLPIWSDHFTLGVVQVGLLTAGLAFAIAVGSIVGGWLGDRLGRGPVFSYDLLVFVLGTGLIMTAPNGTALTTGVIIVGLAAGADVPTSVAVIADAAPEHARGRLVGLTQTLWIGGILATFALGFAVSTLGFAGTQILIAHIVTLAVATLGLRLMLTTRGRAAGRTAVPDPSRAVGIRPRDLVGARVTLPLLTTGLFFAFWNIASATLGNYGTYFLVKVTGLSQSGATGLALLTFPPALLMSLAFVRLADTIWRDRLFVVAMVLQIAAFTAGALTGGTAVLGMVLLIFLYSLSNVFAGEAIYKVWTQRLFPARVRASALGVTYGLARAVAAGFMIVVPVVIERYQGALLWILAACVTVSGAIGLLITHHPRLAGLMRIPDPADGGLRRSPA